jgi:CRP/FNR family transcriptional regulator, cyclic AMP receptor protein
MSEPVARAILKKGVLFADAPDVDIDDVLETGHEVSYDADQVIFAEADERDGMFLMLEGQARVDIGGRYHLLGPGDFFGEMALLVPDKRLATVRAMEPVKALHIPSDTFESFLLGHPHVAVGMLRALALRLREVEQRIDAWMAP